MKRLAAPLGFGLACYLIFLAASVPAAWLYRWRAPVGLALDTPSGTLWQGQATAARLSSTRLQALSWELTGASLGDACLEYALRFETAHGSGDGRLSLCSDGRIQASTLNLPKRAASTHR